MTIPQKPSWILVPLIFIAACGCLAYWPAGTAGLEWSRTAIFQGQLWRLWTGHLTHFHFNQWLWDAGMFALLIYLARPFTSGKRLWVLGLLASPLIGISILFDDSILFYRGLSGLDMALASFIWMLAKPNIGKNSFPWWGLGGLILGKLAFECFVGSLFVQGQQLYRPLPISHISGFVSGLLLAILFRLTPFRRRIS